MDDDEEHDWGCGLDLHATWSGVTYVAGEVVVVRAGGGDTTTGDDDGGDGDGDGDGAVRGTLTTRAVRAMDDVFSLTLGRGDDTASVSSVATVRVAQKAQQGELGTVVWNAAVILCAHARRVGDDLVRGQEVLDIGAGTGVVGFLCATMLGARHVTIADCGPKTMANLAETLAMYRRDARRVERDNARAARAIETVSDDDDDDDDDVVVLNEDDINDGAPWASVRHNIKLRRHLWEEDLEIENARASGAATPLRVRHWSNAGIETNADAFAPTLEPDATFDVIIGSDLLYFSSQEASLAAAIRLRLRPGGACVIVQTLRDNNADVFERFVTEARKDFTVDISIIHLPNTDDASTLAKETPHALANPYRLLTLAWKHHL